MIVLAALALIGLAVAARSYPRIRSRVPLPMSRPESRHHGARSDSLIAESRCQALIRHHPLAAHEGERFPLIELGSAPKAFLKASGSISRAT